MVTFLGVARMVDATAMMGVLGWGGGDGNLGDVQGLQWCYFPQGEGRKIRCSANDLCDREYVRDDDFDDDDDD